MTLEPAQSLAGSIRHNLRPHLASGAILDACDGRLANRSAAFVGAVGFVLVGFLPADERLISFDRASERAARLRRPRLTDLGQGRIEVERPLLRDQRRDLREPAPHPTQRHAVQHEPCGLLGDVQVAVQLHAGHALEAGQAEVDGDGPLAQRDVRAGD